MEEETRMVSFAGVESDFARIAKMAKLYGFEVDDSLTKALSWRSSWSNRRMPGSIDFDTQKKRLSYFPISVHDPEMYRQVTFLDFAQLRQRMANIADEEGQESNRRFEQEETGVELERFASWARERFPDDEIRKKVLLGLVHGPH